MRGRTISPETRAEIERLLREGRPDRAIAHQVGVHHVTVSKIHKALGLPRHPSGRKSYPTLAEAFHAHTEPVNGGHLRWTGNRAAGGTPRVMHAGHTYSAYRIAFLLRTGREPVGKALPGCDFDGCVAPVCMTDQRQRERDRAAYTGIFGGGAS